jgi:hypothetical protein
MAEVPKLLHKMSVTSQKAWYKKNNMPLPPHLTGDGTMSATQAKKAQAPSARVQTMQAASAKAYGATRGTAMGSEDGKGVALRDTVKPLSPEQHSKVSAAKRVVEKPKPVAAKPAAPAAPKKPLSASERIAAIARASRKIKSGEKYAVPTIDPNEGDHEDLRDLHHSLHIGSDQYNEEVAKKVVVKTNAPIGYKIVDIGPGGKEHNVKTNKAWDDKKGKKEVTEESATMKQYIEEKLTKSDPASKWISDFVHSDNPKFAGKSKAERIKMALGAKYAAQRNEEVEQVDEAKGYYVMHSKGQSLGYYKNKQEAEKHAERHNMRGGSIAKVVADTKEEVEQVEEATGKGDHRPGWMLRADPKLAAKFKEKEDQHKKMNSLMKKYGGKTGDEIKAMKKEEVELNEKDDREYGYEGDMAMSQLKSIIANSQRLHEMLKPNTDLPEWVQSKITLAEDYITTAANYCASDLEEEVQIDEASYSAKAARAGKDIGKPGKNFAKIAASAGKRYGSKEAGKRVAGAILAKLRKEALDPVGKEDADVNNDGKADKTDVYLAKRRKAVGNAISKTASGKMDK